MQTTTCPTVFPTLLFAGTSAEGELIDLVTLYTVCLPSFFHTYVADGDHGRAAASYNIQNCWSLVAEDLLTGLLFNNLGVCTRQPTLSSTSRGGGDDRSSKFAIPLFLAKTSQNL
jgi:hypothetical protein